MMDRVTVSLIRRSRMLVCALIICFGGMMGSTAQARTLVEGISFDERADGQGYVIRIHANARIDAYSMPQIVDEQYLEWTLFNTDLGASFERVPPGGPVDRYETDVDEGHLTFRFFLPEGHEISATAYRDRASDDLLLGLTYDGDPPPVHAADGASDDASLPVTSTLDGPATEAGPSEEGDRRERVSRERWRLDTVVIDPGHGGKDPGAQGHGVREKDVVLDVAKILGDYLEEKLGVRVVYTRTDDRFVELNDRGHIANEAGGKLFISLHANASKARAARGTETYFLGPHKSEDARRVMEQENKVVNLESNPDQYDAFDEDALVRYTLTESAYMRQSEMLAAAVEQQFDERVHHREQSRGVKQAGLIVLWSASMPAILVELGFLTNPSEARFLASRNGKVYLASAIFRAVRDYKESYEKGLNLARIGEQE